MARPAIVNTASIVGLRPGPQPLAPYAASKAAVVNLTKTLAWNLGPHIRVNAVAPGWMEGDWMERMLGDKYDELMGARAKATPLKRCVTADDVAEVMLNLITGLRFVTGEDRRDRRRLHQLHLTLRGDTPCWTVLSPFPAEFAAALPRAAATGSDQSAGAGVRGWCSSALQTRTALIDGERRLDLRRAGCRVSDNLALNLLDLGLQPLDRVVPTLPNVARVRAAVLRAAEDRLHSRLPHW